MRHGGLRGARELVVPGFRGRRRRKLVRKYARRLILLSAAIAICLAVTGCAGFFFSTASETGLITSATSATYGTSIVLTATVSTESSKRTGTVTFYDGSTSLGTGTLSSAEATLTTASLAVGTHTLTAVYGGDGTYAESTSNAVTVVISSALTTTTTTLAASATSITYGTAVTLTGTVSTTAATGTIMFYSGSSAVGVATVSSGVGSTSTVLLPVGTDSVTAVYSGDTTYASSTSSAVSVVVKSSS